MFISHISHYGLSLDLWYLAYCVTMFTVCHNVSFYQLSVVLWFGLVGLFVGSFSGLLKNKIMKNVSIVEGIVIGFFIGLFSPAKLGGLANWQWWAYIVVMNVIVQYIYQECKAWWISRKLAKEKA